MGYENRHFFSNCFSNFDGLNYKISLCSDLVYVVLFPQLFCVVYFKRTNTYGSMVAYWTGIILRLLAGESLFGIRPVIKYPLFDEELDMQKFPFRTTSMLVSFILNISVSLFTQFIFENEYLSKNKYSNAPDNRYATYPTRSLFTTVVKKFRTQVY